MTTVGAFEAKTHLNQLLTRTLKGEVIQITRWACLSPNSCLQPSPRSAPTSTKSCVVIARPAKVRGLENFDQAID